MLHSLTSFQWHHVPCADTDLVIWVPAVEVGERIQPRATKVQGFQSRRKRNTRTSWRIKTVASTPQWYGKLHLSSCTSRPVLTIRAIVLIPNHHPCSLSLLLLLLVRLRQTKPPKTLIEKPSVHSMWCVRKEGAILHPGQYYTAGLGAAWRKPGMNWRKFLAGLVPWISPSIAGTRGNLDTGSNEWVHACSLASCSPYGIYTLFRLPCRCAVNDTLGSRFHPAHNHPL